MFLSLSEIIGLMIEFVVEKSFTTSEDIVWRIVRDVNSIPNYWKGVRELNVKEVGKNVYEGKIRFAFPSSGKVRIIVNDDERLITFEYLDGPIRGYNKVKVSKGKISSEWRVTMSGLLKLIENWNRDHFMEGTEHALERILNAALNSSP
ncbi:SRPBCC family protein [Saccharolobus solfataricus]|uniref:SRPBCC family protein n=2 Tax=Saccharolobus solfataricus TaxID=2287 RepID=A0A0E3MI49_SACSO|nr:SRPBCC family protein [Saccharolobus solfataricus]AKA74342.1 SRPBCC family protein [Saccharolobus solfataricus]AKA77038.1 SRPBCC family protein [Saccharolobus solfataricus]AKA79730.1 SRPBCC family protein [Saccharolobus solfataricus]AZF68825.1 SRPBCC family protein [Saccharolobus solfataricus]AZF71445.1 SRPBCC family protein [Saccharolobus solfataricus]